MSGTVNRSGCGVLLIVNGTRSPIGQAQSDEFVSLLKRRLGRAVPVLIAYMEVRKPNLPMAFRLIDTLDVQRWLCVPLFVSAPDYGKFAKYVKGATYFMAQRSDLELFWMSPWGAKSQLISLVAGAVSKMLLEYMDRPRILLVGGSCTSVNTFQNYKESARRISRLVGEDIEACVLTGVGPNAKQVLDESVSSLKSVLVVPYVSFEGLLLQKLRQVARDANLKSRQHVAQIDALFVQESIVEYVYTAIEHRLHQAGIRNGIGSSLYARKWGT